MNKLLIENYGLRTKLYHLLEYFNTHAILDGTPTWETYFENHIQDFGENNFGLAIRIEEGLAIQTANIELFITVIASILALLIIIFGIAILWNQRKIKKMLREMQKQKGNEPVS